VEPGRRAADSVTGKEGIGHGKDRRRHGKLIPRPLSFVGGPWGLRFRSSEALSTSREARTRPGEERPRTWNVGSDDGRASLGVVGSPFEVARRSSHVVESSDEDLGRAGDVLGRTFRRPEKDDRGRGTLRRGSGKFVRRRGSSIPGRGKLGRGPRMEGVARTPRMKKVEVGQSQRHRSSRGSGAPLRKASGLRATCLARSPSHVPIAGDSSRAEPVKRYSACRPVFASSPPSST
jgi:hypothetical protein